MEDKKLQGKVIVISGGTKGVGKAAAEEFAKEGAKVVIGGRVYLMNWEVLDDG